MPTTPRFGMTLLEEAQAGKANQVNSALALIDNAAGLALANTFTARNTFSLAATADADEATVQMGSGGFAGPGGNNFLGRSTGTVFGMNSALAFGGSLIDAQQGGVSRLRLSANGDAYMPRIPGTETTHGTLNLGHGPFDGSTSGFFTGSSAGQVLAINSTSGFAGRLVEVQTAGVSRFRILGDGRVGVGVGSTLAAQLYVSRPAVAANPSNPSYFRIDGVADTAMAASTEVPDVDLRLNRTLQFATGALTDQRAFKLLAPTYAFVGSSTITNAATLYIDNAPVAGTNATITNRYSLWADSGKARFDGDGTHVWELPADATDPTGGGGAAVGRIPCLIGGALRYIPYY